MGRMKQTNIEDQVEINEHGPKKASAADLMVQQWIQQQMNESSSEDEEEE